MSVLRWTTSRFEERRLATPRLDAEILIAAALGLPRLQLYVQFDRPLGADELRAIREYVRRRQGGASVAYIVGKKEFFGLEFAVDERVLVPRPDTETLVDEALACMRPAPRHDQDGPVSVAAEPGVSPPAPPVFSPRIAEVGTGSGAVIVTLGKRLPDATLFAVDLSGEALTVAAANAERHGVAVTFLMGDLAAPLAAHAPFALVVANLPYVPSGAIDGLAPEVRAEPRLALDGGPDGLDLVRRLVAATPGLLAPGGALVLEVGDGQAEQAAMLCREAGLVDVQMRRDLGAVDRVVSARKP
jgi:release factor glutamine methyltransferase